MQRALFLAVCAVALTACFSPDYGPCALHCDPAASEDFCPGALTCGTDGFCHADGEELCTAPARALEVSLSGTGTGTVTSDVGGIACGALCTGSVPDGTTVTFTAEPASGSRFTGWTGACTGTDPCVIEVEDDVTLGAGFNQARSLTITFTDFAGVGTGHVVSAAAGIDCDDDCVVAVDANSTVALTASPDVDSRFLDWGGACTGAACQLTMDADKTVSVRYLLTPEVSVLLAGSGDGTVTSAPAGIACPAPACDARFDHDTAVTLTAAAVSGSRFDSWSGACESAAATCDVVTTADQAVTAKFIELEVLSVTDSGSGAGTVTSSAGGISCINGVGVCSAELDLDSFVQVSASPSTGSRFGGWAGDCSGGISPCPLTMNGPKSVDAQFIKTWPLDITITGSGAGQVTTTPPGTICTSTCSLTEDDQQLVTLVAAPNGTSRFGGWSGACTNATGPCVTTITAATTVTATFIRTYVLDVTIAGSVGRATSAPVGIDCPGTCSATFDTGTPVTVTVDPDPGVVLDAWSGDCTGATCNVTMSADRDVTANLEGGHLAWWKRYGGAPYYGYEELMEVASDSSGSVVVGTISGGTMIDFGGTIGQLTSVGARDVLVIAYTATGTVRWARMLNSGATGWSIGYAVALAPDGDVLVGGQFTETLDVGGGHTATANNWDGFVARLDGTTGAGEWVARLTSGNQDWITHVEASDAGDVLVIGTCNRDSTATTDCVLAGGTALDIDDVGYDVVGQLGGDGSFGWIRRLQRAPCCGAGADYATKVLAASDGDAIVAGFFAGLGVPDFGGGAVAPSAARTTSYLVRFEAADGAHVWSRGYGGMATGGTNANTEFSTAALDPSGNIVVAGHFDNQGGGTENVSGVIGGPVFTCNGQREIFVATYDATDGDYVAGFHMGGDYAGGAEQPTSLAIDPSGDLSMVGIFSAPATTLGVGAGAITLTNLGGTDGFIAKMSPSGALRWAQLFGATGTAEWVTGVAVDAAGRVAVVGRFNTPSGDNIVVDGTTFPGIDAGGWESVVLTFGP